MHIIITLRVDMYVYIYCTIVFNVEKTVRKRVSERKYPTMINRRMEISSTRFVRAGKGKVDDTLYAGYWTLDRWPCETATNVLYHNRHAVTVG